MKERIRKEKVVYNYELLLKVLERDGAKINEELFKNEKVNRDKRIDFLCSCGKEGNKTFRGMFEKGTYCKECANERMIQKCKETSLERYGCDNPSKSEKIKQKIKDVCLERFGVEIPAQLDEIKKKVKKIILEKYGVENVSQAEEIKEKIRKTNLEKYGIENPFQSEEIKEKIKKTNLKKYGVEISFQAEEIKEKIKKTNLERYGVEYNLQREEVKEKTKKDNLIRYGVENVSQVDEFKEKAKLTNLQRYGVENVSQADEIKEKMKQTNLERYGVEYPQQNAIISEKASKYAYKLKSYIFPSRKEIKVQGYENIALDFLINRGYNEDDIITSRTKVPEIWWVDSNGKKHRYYVDIFIKSENKFIEVKSTWTFSRDDKKEKIEKTKEAVKEKGYLYELWLINKGKIIEVIN